MTANTSTVGFLTVLLLGAVSPASCQVDDLRAEVGHTSWVVAKKHTIVEYLLTCPWLEFSDGEIALRTNSDSGSGGTIDDPEFDRRQASLVHAEGGIIVEDCVFDLDDDYVSLQMESSYGFKTTLTATFFDRRQKPPVVALAYQTETPIGPDEFSYLFCECNDGLQDWHRSDVLDESALDTFLEPAQPDDLAWECLLPQSGGDVKFVPHASTAMAGDPYAYDKLVNQLKNVQPSSVIYRWNYARGHFEPLGE